MSICDDCASKLEIAYNFKHQCEKTDASLRKILDMPPQNQEIIFKEQKNNENKSLVLYNNFSQIENIDINEVIDITPLIQQKNIFIENYIYPVKIENEDLEIIQRDEIFNLIQERKRNYSVDDKKIFITTDSTKIINEDVFNEYSCLLCPVIYGDEESLKKHMTECSKKCNLQNDDSGENFPPFECHTCNKTFKSKHARKIHMETHLESDQGKNNVYICDVCDKIFSNESKLALHFYNHAKLLSKEFMIDENRPTTCPKCSDIFTNEQDLNKHQQEMHKKVTCEICTLEFEGESNLIQHLKKHGITIAYCKICFKRFETSNKLRTHLKTHTTEKKRSIFNCALCKKQFDKIELLKAHSIKHLNETYKCDKCKRNFNNVVTYKTHLIQHSEPKFLCSFCGKQYFNAVTLQGHIRSHNNERPFICPHCDKGFTSRATLSVHKRIHSSFKPYVCSYCGYSCRQSGDLAMHIRTHTGDKPYKCTFPNCDRKFTTSSQRKEHYRRHTNERNHKCKECGKAFLESKTLKVHMLTHTGEKPHPCEVCGKKFRRTHHLANHIKMHMNCTNILVQEDIHIVSEDVIM